MQIARKFILGLCTSIGPILTHAGTIIPAPEADPHYTTAGFFDIHVCNWPTGRNKIYAEQEYHARKYG